jgi:hypothetical protein
VSVRRASTRGPRWYSLSGATIVAAELVRIGTPPSHRILKTTGSILLLNHLGIVQERRLIDNLPREYADDCSASLNPGSESHQRENTHRIDVQVRLRRVRVRIGNRNGMGSGAVQTRSGEEDLLEFLALVVTIIEIQRSVQGDVELSVIAPLRAEDPYGGPVEGESGGGAVRRRQRERSVVSIPKPLRTDDEWWNKVDSLRR